MKKILIGSIACNFGEHLLNEFSDNTTHKLTYETDMSKVNELIHNETFHACIINFDDITPLEFEHLQSITDNVPHVPILILGNNNEFTSNLVTSKKRVHFMPKPVSQEQVRGFINKLMLVKQLPEQKFKRFKTDQCAEIEKLDDGDTFIGSVKNLSMGGAYIILEDDHHLSIGTLVRLNVHNEDSERKALNAKIIWVKNLNENEVKNFSFGLKFLNQGEIMTA